MAYIVCHPEQCDFCTAKDLGEPRNAPRSLRRQQARVWLASLLVATRRNQHATNSFAETGQERSPFGTLTLAPVVATELQLDYSVNILIRSAYCTKVRRI